jgi:hypothetical protein
MAEHHWIVVDIDDPCLGGGALRDLVGVVRRRQAATDVEELQHAVVGSPAMTRSPASRSAAKLSLPPSQ